MNDRQMISFITVADKGSFYKAATALFISSQALIAQMNQLEHEVGVPLLDRSHKGITLTEAGEVFYKGAQGLLRQQKELMDRTRETLRGKKQKIRLTIASTPSFMHLIATRFAQ